MGKVTFLAASISGGGAQAVCRRLASLLLSQGHEVTILSLRDDIDDSRVLLDPRVQLECLHCSHTRYAGVVLHAWLRRQRPEIVMAFSHQLAILLLLVRTLARLNFRIVARNISMLSQKRNFTGLWHGRFIDWIVRRLYRRVDLVVAQSDAMANDLACNYGIPKNRIVRIYNPGPDYGGRCAERNIPRSREVLFVGRLDPVKDLCSLVEAFHELFSRDPGVSLRIVGDGTERVELEQLAAKLGLASAVKFEGFRRDVADYYYRATVVALTSRYEGFPNVLVEAISCGTPVVAFDCPGGVAEIVRDGENGRLVSGRSTSQFALALQDVIRNPPGEDSVLSSARRFRSAEIVAQYESVLFGETSTPCGAEMGR